jgi:PAS domain S-box-containing protein
MFCSLPRDWSRPATRPKPGRPARQIPVATLLVLGLFLSPASTLAQPKSVLVLSSESLAMPGLAATVREASSELQARAQGAVNIYTESLDRSRFPGDDRRLLELLAGRYSGRRPDVVITLAIPALNFALKYRDQLFPGTPILYSIVDERMAAAFSSQPLTSGVAYQADLLALTDLALKLHPNVRRVAVAGGVSEFDREWQASYKQIAPRLESRAAIRYLTDSTLAELLGEIATLPDDALVIYLTMTSDRDRVVYAPRDVMDMIRRVAAVPVYSPSGSYVGHGAVGGPVFDIEAHGKAVGRMAARILSGEPIGAIKPEVTPSRLAFDSRELIRFGVTESLLPAGAEVLFRPSDLPIHRGWIVAVAALFAAQTALIVALVVQRRKSAALQRSLDDRLGFGTLLSDVSTALNAVPLRSLEGTIRSVLERIRQHFDVDDLAILDTAVRPVSCRAHAGAEPAGPSLAAAAALVETSFGSVRLASLQPLVLASLDDLPRDAGVERQMLADAGVTSLAVVAMEVGGQVLGVLCGLSRARQAAWTAEQQQQLRTLAEVLANALQRQETAAEVSGSDRLKGAILSSMAAHITVLDRRGEIIAVNDAWMDFGRANGLYEETSISPGSNYLTVCERAAAGGDDSAREALEGIRAVCDAKTKVFELEYRCDGTDAERWFHMKVAPLRRPEGGVVVTHREVTDDRRRELALRESERRFRVLADALPVGVWMGGLDGRCTYVNRTWLEWTGRPLDRELGDGWTDRVHPDDVRQAVRSVLEAIASRRPCSAEFRLQGRDGKYRWLLNHVRPRQDEAGEAVGFVAGCTDMTERLESQARLHELSGRLIRAQEEERRRVARELHDDLQQRLALLAIEIEGMSLGRPVGRRSDRAGEARRLWTQTNEIASEVHRIAHRLLPMKLETLGLLRTAESYCRDIGQEGVRVVFSPNNVPAEVPDEAALTVFRALQEALRNVVKHSGSGEAHVALTGDERWLTLVVTDTGRGFEPDGAAAGDGLGLLSMRERLRLIGGEISIRSGVGAGTRVEVRVPVGRAAQPRGDRAPDPPRGAGLEPGVETTMPAPDVAAASPIGMETP